MILWSCGFLVSKTFPNVHLVFLNKYWSHIHDVQDFSKDLHHCSVPVFSKIVNILGFQNSDILIKIICAKMFGDSFLISFRYPGTSKDKNNWFLGSWTRQKMPNS